MRDGLEEWEGGSAGRERRIVRCPTCCGLEVSLDPESWRATEQH